MRLEREAEQLVQRDLAVAIEEHGAHAGNVFTLAAATVRCIDAHPYGRAMLSVAPGEHRQIVRREVHMPSERIRPRLVPWLGVCCHLERELRSVLIKQGQESACLV
jgi:hypothetical protein